MTVEQIIDRIIDGDTLVDVTDLYQSVTDDELSHYGILGMKWGIRRTPSQLGHKTPKKRLQRTETKEEREKRLQREHEERMQKAQLKAQRQSERLAYKTKKLTIRSEESTRRAQEKEKQRQYELQREKDRQQREEQRERFKRKTNSDVVDAKSLSDEELRAAINRIQLEKQYKELTKKNRPFIDFGKKIVVGSAEGIAKTAITKFAMKGINKLVGDDDKKDDKGKDKKKETSTSLATFEQLDELDRQEKAASKKKKKWF